MQGMGWTLGRRRTREIVRIVVDAFLFILLCILATGIWVCQWVPLSF